MPGSMARFGRFRIYDEKQRVNAASFDFWLVLIVCTFLGVLVEVDAQFLRVVFEMNTQFSHNL